MMKKFLNNLIEKNCLEVMKEIPSKSVDMILCDLPYGTTQNKWDSVIPRRRQRGRRCGTARTSRSGYGEKISKRIINCIFHIIEL
jgi:DNA modification methylase